MTSKPSILALLTDAFGGRGGIAQYNRDFLSALAGSGIVSSILVLPRHAPDPELLPQSITQASPRAGRIAYSLTALGAAVRHRPGIVFCGHLYMAPLAALIARLRGARLIVQMHGIEAWQRPSHLRRTAVETADLVLCVSRYTRAAVLGWAAIAPERVVVLPDTAGDAFTPGDGSAMREACNLLGKKVLLTVGRMDARERYKGHDRVIAVLPQLVAGGDDVMYVVVGGGDDRARLESLAREAGLSDRVRFMGAVSREMLLDAFRMADLFIMPSTGEGFGIAFLEAMASGTPALGLAEAGALDALADGELGTIVAEADLPEAIASVLKTNKSPQELASAVQSRFGLKRFAGGVRNALLRLGEAA